MAEQLSRLQRDLAELNQTFETAKLAPDVLADVRDRVSDLERKITALRNRLAHLSESADYSDADYKKLLETILRTEAPILSAGR